MYPRPWAQRLLTSTHSFSFTFTFISGKEIYKGGHQTSFFSLNFTFKPIICSSIVFSLKNPKPLNFILSSCCFLFIYVQYESSRARICFLIKQIVVFISDNFLPVYRRYPHQIPYGKPQFKESQILSSLLFLFFFVSHTSEVSLAQGEQSCPAAKDNSQNYLQFLGLVVIWAEQEGGLGEG